MKSRDRIAFLCVGILAAVLLLIFYKNGPEHSRLDEFRLWTTEDGQEYRFVPAWLAEEAAEEDREENVMAGQLVSVEISTQSGDMEIFKEGKEVTESGTIRITEADGTVVFDGKMSEIRGRGNTTFGLDKQPFQFKLEEEVSLLGMGSGRTWILLSNAFDESLMRNMIALDMAEAAGMEYVSGLQAVDLFCNGAYWGVYNLTEKVEVSSSRVDVGNGFLLEREMEDRFWEEEEFGFLSEQGDAYIQHYPENGQGTEEIEALVNAMELAVWSEDGTNPQTGKYYTEYLDLDSFVRKYILEELLQNYDGGVSSAYYYTDSDGILYAGPPWDYDSCLGSCQVKYAVRNPEEITLLGNSEYSTELYEALWAHEDFRERTAQLYETEFRPFVESLLNGGIDSYAEQMGQSMEMNEIRWSDSYHPNRYYQDFHNEIRYLKYFLDKREAMLDEKWLGRTEHEDRSALWTGEGTHQIIWAVNGEAWRFDEDVPDGTLLEELPVPEEYEGTGVYWRLDGTEEYVTIYRPVYEDQIFVLMLPE